MRRNVTDRLALCLLICGALAIPAAADGLQIDVFATTADQFNTAYCNAGGGFNFSATAPTLAASGNCGSVTVPYTGAGVGSDTMAASASAWANYGSVGASINATESGSESVAPSTFSGPGGGAVANADAQFADSAFLNVAGVAKDTPLNITFGFTLTGSAVTSFSSTFTGNTTPQFDYGLVLYLGPDGGCCGSEVSVQNYYGNPLAPGAYSVTYTALNQENISFFANLSLQAQFFALPATPGAFNASADVNFFNTMQLTQIGISDGVNSYSNYSLIGASNGTDYQQVLPEQDATPEPASGAMALLVCGGAIAWLKRRR